MKTAIRESLVYAVRDKSTTYALYKLTTTPFCRSVACALFESQKGFPVEFLLSATNVMVIKVRKTRARCDFEDIPPGTYALAVIHDENVNGKLDVNALGMPKEGYGFSNDVKAWFGAPSFEEASFKYDGRNLDLTIALHY